MKICIYILYVGIMIFNFKCLYDCIVMINFCLKLFYKMYFLVKIR